MAVRLSLFGGSPESGIANVLLLGWGEVKWPTIGGAALNRAIDAFTDWNIVKNLGANPAKDLGKTLVDFDLVGPHALACFIQGLLGGIEQFYTDFTPLASDHCSGFAEHFLGFQFAIEFCFEAGGLNKRYTNTCAGPEAGYQYQHQPLFHDVLYSFIHS